MKIKRDRRSTSAQNMELDDYLNWGGPRRSRCKVREAPSQLLGVLANCAVQRLHVDTIQHDGSTDLNTSVQGQIQRALPVVCTAISSLANSVHSISRRRLRAEKAWDTKVARKFLQFASSNDG